MTTFVWVSFGCSAFGVVVHLLCLAFVPYPRTVKWERWEDLLQIVLSAVWCIYGWYVLHG